MGSNQQDQNQMSSEELDQFLNSIISYQEGYYLYGGSSMGDASIDLLHSAAQMPHQDTLVIPGNMDINRQSTTTNTRTSIEESPMITDANSSLAGVSCLRSNGNDRAELIASNSGRISGTSSGNYLPAQQQILQAGQTYPGRYAKQADELSNNFNPQLVVPAYQASVPPSMNKKPRLEMKPDNTLNAHSLQQQSTSQVPLQLHQKLSSSQVPVHLQQQLSPSQVPMQLHQQISPSQVPMQLQSYNPVVDSRMFQQPLIQNQQHNQIPLSNSSSRRHLVQRLPQQQIPRDVQNQVADITNQRKKASICVLRLMQYMRHQRRRPSDNNINYWRTFVGLYYSPFAKKRWCFSTTPNEGYQDFGIDSWKCELCGSNSGKGFEIYYEALPRMHQIYFNSAVIDELLYLEAPDEVELPSGFMMLTFEKAVVDSVYKHFRVVHEGKLCIFFTPELKIISWEFCIQSHEDLVSRRFVATQVNKLVKSAAKCLSKTKLKESEGFPAQDLLSDFHRIVAEGKNLTENLKLPPIDDLSFPKQFVRCVQMVEVLNSMKDLMADNQTNHSSPIETMKRYHQQDANEKVKKQKRRAQMQQTPNADRSNFQVDRYMTQTSDAKEQQVMFNPSNYHQNLMMEEQRISLDSNQCSHDKLPFSPMPYHHFNLSENSLLGPSSTYYENSMMEEQRICLDSNHSSHDKPFSSMPYQHLSSSENSFLGPSSALKDLILKRQINDILMSMHAKRIQGNCSDDGGVVYDPIEDEELDTIVEEEASTSNRLGGMLDKGKRCNYSSSSNSTPRIIFTDNCMLKKDTVSDDDTTSAPSHQQVEEH